MLSRYTHKNLISLLGFCDEDDEKIIVYEYACNASLDRHLSSPSLTWTQRIKICLGAANGLRYLHDHHGSQQRVLHRDIKSSNILLDANWNAKVSDMGLAKLAPANQQHTVVYTNIVGTPGYCDPQYMHTYKLTKESDIYSFGVVLFEVLCGKLCFNLNKDNDLEILVPSWKRKYKHNLQDIVFQDLRPSMNSNSLETFSSIAFKCLHDSREQRPTISQVVEKLNCALEFQALHEQRPTISQVMQKLERALKFQELHDKKLFEDKMGDQRAFYCSTDENMLKFGGKKKPEKNEFMQHQYLERKENQKLMEKIYREDHDKDLTQCYPVSVYEERRRHLGARTRLRDSTRMETPWFRLGGGYTVDLINSGTFRETFPDYGPIREMPSRFA